MLSPLLALARIADVTAPASSAATPAATHAATPDVTATATHATTATTASVSDAPGQHTAQDTDAARPAQQLAMAPPSTRQPSIDLIKQSDTPYRRVYRDPAVVTAALQRLSQGERWHDIAALGESHTSGNVASLSACCCWFGVISPAAGGIAHSWL